MPLWRSFLQEYTPPEQMVWSVKSVTRAVKWLKDVAPPPSDTPVKVHNADGRTLVLSARHEILGYLRPPIPSNWSGLLLSCIGTRANTAALRYYGPDDIDLGKLRLVPLFENAIERAEGHVGCGTSYIPPVKRKSRFAIIES